MDKPSVGYALLLETVKPLGSNVREVCIV